MKNVALQPPKSLRDLPTGTAPAQAGLRMPRSVLALLERLEAHDPYTAAHSRRVGAYATLLARVLRFESQEVEIVRRAAFVHDVGKLGIPLDVLGKTTALTDEEFELIKQHPIIGTTLLEEKDLKDLVPMVLHHHERWDGRGGYPTGLCGIDIPIQSRIILVADAFDAMTTNRPYGRVCTPAESMTEIERCSGRQFDPLVAEAMSFAYHAGLLGDEVIVELEQGAALPDLLRRAVV